MPINIDGSKGIHQNTTETTQTPVGTTAQRPFNPAARMIRFNTDEGYVEWYDPTFDDWAPVSAERAGVIATGGTVTDITQDGKQPYDSWEWDGERWNPPVPHPDDDRDYQWNEENQEWIEVTEDE